MDEDQNKAMLDRLVKITTSVAHAYIMTVYPASMVFAIFGNDWLVWLLNLHPGMPPVDVLEQRLAFLDWNASIADIVALLALHAALIWIIIYIVTEHEDTQDGARGRALFAVMLTVGTPSLIGLFLWTGIYVVEFLLAMISFR